MKKRPDDMNEHSLVSIKFGLMNMNTAVEKSWILSDSIIFETFCHL